MITAKLAIIDYANSKMHIFNIDPSEEKPEEVMSKNGIHVSNCEWMLSDKLEILVH